MNIYCIYIGNGVFAFGQNDKKVALKHLNTWATTLLFPFKLFFFIS